MKELFEDLYVGFFEETSLQMVTENKQQYMDYLAALVIEGEGYLPSLEQPEEFIERKLTAKEEEEIYYRIGLWLNSLN